MGLEAIYPKPNLSRRCPEYAIYPYLLRNYIIDTPYQVWSAVTIPVITIKMGSVDGYAATAIARGLVKGFELLKRVNSNPTLGNVLPEYRQQFLERKFHCDAYKFMSFR